MIPPHLRAQALKVGKFTGTTRHGEIEEGSFNMAVLISGCKS